MKLVFSCLAILAAFAAISRPGVQAAGLARVANTTLKMPPVPPAYGYQVVKAFGELLFPSPVAIVTPPGETNRIFIVEQRGRIAVITNLAQPTRSIFLDITARVTTDAINGDERGLLGLAFHPGYATNGCFFVYYSTTASTALGTGLHERLARFQVSPADPQRALPDSEVPLFTQFDPAANHNGGDLHFGPEGYLYVSLGDGGGLYDQFGNSQHIDLGFHSGILRLDVDQRAGNLPPNPYPGVNTNANGSANYLIPADNPWVGATSFNTRAIDPQNVRTEFWAVGLRNPWRMSFDPVTGVLYCGDVGQDRFEEVNIIVKGGNYGWSYQDASIPGPLAGGAPAGFTSIPPIVEYPHGVYFDTTDPYIGNSVTGGLVYRGQRISQLFGAYVFSDYVNGNIWMTRYDGTNATRFQYLTREYYISAFGADPSNGDILMASVLKTNIMRLVYDTNQVTGPALPPTLADTGAFADLTTLTPNPGIVPYELNVPFWSDYALKRRWFSLPDPAAKLGFNRDGNWSLPAGAVWIKHFELEMTRGVPTSARRLETRLIVRNANGVYGATYRWGDSLTNATLVPEEGLTETFAINDHGVTRNQTWRYPGRAECLACHTAAGGFALGFNTAQLYRDFDHGSGLENQIRALSRAGYFQTEPQAMETLPALASATDSTASLEHRVRSYLAANCVQCHQPGGPALAGWDGRIHTPFLQAGILNGETISPASQQNQRVVKPGSAAESALLARIITLGEGRMPPLASTELNQSAIALLTEWIQSDSTNRLTFPAWQIRYFGSTNAPDAAPGADPDGDGAFNEREFVLGQDPLVKDAPLTITATPEAAAVRLSFTHVANRVLEVQFTTNLANAASWSPLDVPGNRPLPWATAGTNVLHDSPAQGAAKYYRVRVSEP